MPSVYRLDDKLWFPNPYLGEESGLVAVGGDLSPERLLLAYSQGFFPWFAYRIYKEPHWYCPVRRFVIFPDEIHISHSMRTLMRKNRYEVTFNEAFDRVIRECMTADGRDNDHFAWLGEDIIDAYTELHHHGHAFSVEVWENPLSPGEDRRLAGGLYGVQSGRGFMGESMFSLVPSGSKLALIYLAQKALKEGWNFIDCQFETPHFRSMGGRYISYSDYMSLLQ